VLPQAANSCLAGKRLIQLSAFQKRMKIKSEQPICGFGCCFSRNGKFQPQDSVEGTLPSGPKNMLIILGKLEGGRD
jgi:hypothetical protein